MKLTTDSICTNCGRRQKCYLPMGVELYSLFTYCLALILFMSIFCAVYSMADIRNFYIPDLNRLSWIHFVRVMMFLIPFCSCIVCLYAVFRVAQQATRRFVIYERGWTQCSFFVGHRHLWADVSGIAIRKVTRPAHLAGMLGYDICFKDANKPVITIQGYRAEKSLHRTLQQKAAEFGFEFHEVQ
jgi:hypothetical protein